METNNPKIVAAVALFISLFIAYSIVAAKKRKGASWSGVVLDKDMTETNNTAGQNTNQGIGINLGGNRNAIDRNYNLKIKDDSGKEFNWPVGQGFYESVKVGDKLIKESGTETPRKV